MQYFLIYFFTYTYFFFGTEHLECFFKELNYSLIKDFQKLYLSIAIPFVCIDAPFTNY